jgi:hypothetical protein
LRPKFARWSSQDLRPSAPLGVAAQQRFGPLQFRPALRPRGLRQVADRLGAKARLERPDHGQIGDPERRERRLRDVRGPLVGVIGDGRGDREGDRGGPVDGQPAPVPDLRVPFAGIEPLLDEVEAALDLRVRQGGVGGVGPIGRVRRRQPADGNDDRRCDGPAESDHSRLAFRAGNR